MEVMDMTEKERMDTKMATLYELRLIISNGEKHNGKGLIKIWRKIPIKSIPFNF